MGEVAWMGGMSVGLGTRVFKSIMGGLSFQKSYEIILFQHFSKYF